MCNTSRDIIRYYFSTVAGGRPCSYDVMQHSPFLSNKGDTSLEKIGHDFSKKSQYHYHIINTTNILVRGNANANAHLTVVCIEH